MPRIFRKTSGSAPPPDGFEFDGIPRVFAARSAAERVFAEPAFADPAFAARSAVVRLSAEPVSAAPVFAVRPLAERVFGVLRAADGLRAGATRLCRSSVPGRNFFWRSPQVRTPWDIWRSCIRRMRRVKFRLRYNRSVCRSYRRIPPFPEFYLSDFTSFRSRRNTDLSAS